MPAVLAASTIRVPAGTLILRPSMVRLTSGIRGDSLGLAGAPQAELLVFPAEVAKRRVDHPARGVAESAQAPAVLQTVRDALQDAELDLRPLSGQDLFVDPHRPVAADPARR